MLLAVVAVVAVVRWDRLEAEGVFFQQNPMASGIGEKKKDFFFSPTIWG